LKLEASGRMNDSFKLGGCGKQPPNKHLQGGYFPLR